MISVLIISILLISLASIILIGLERRETRKREEELKNYLSSMVSLSVSHLHDAANFFELIKTNPNLKSQELKDFSKGAAYHFRSLFDEMKASTELFKTANLESLINNRLKFFYKKERINLEDLLDMELFQLSDPKRVQILNKIKTGPAFIHGNFSLLSKAILNLIENALKHTEEKIRIELSESMDNPERFTIKIYSSGEAIPKEVLKELSDLSEERFKELGKENKALGHGFESIIELMNFHGANFSADSIESSGSCINLEFKKYTNDKTIEPEFSLEPEQTKGKKLFRLASASLIAAIIFLSSASIYLFQASKHKSGKSTFKKLKTNKIKDLKLITELEEIIDRQFEDPDSKEQKLTANRNKDPELINTLDEMIDEQFEKLGEEFEIDSSL